MAKQKIKIVKSTVKKSKTKHCPVCGKFMKTR